MSKPSFSTLQPLECDGDHLVRSFIALLLPCRIFAVVLEMCSEQWDLDFMKNDMSAGLSLPHLSNACTLSSWLNLHATLCLADSA